MAEVNLRSWPEISQAADGLQLNPTAATLEYIHAKLAQFETRLDELDRMAAATHPPFRPEPDPPDGPTLYATAQPPHQWPSLYQPPADRDPPYGHHCDWPTSAPPSQPPEMQDWRWQPHQPHTQPVQTRRPTSWDPPTYWETSGQRLFHEYSAYDQSSPLSDPDTYTTVRQPTSWDLPSQHQSVEFQHFDQPPSPQPSCWAPPQAWQPPRWEPQSDDQPMCWIPPAPCAPQQPSPGPAPPFALPPYTAFEPPLYAPSRNTQPELQPWQPDHLLSAYVLLKTSSLDVLNCAQIKNLIVDCDQVEEGFDDSPIEKGDINGNLEVGEEDVAKERKIVEEEKSNLIMKAKSEHVCVEEDEVPPQHLECFPDYDGHTLVPIELVDSMADKHLGEGNGENKDRDRVDKRESLVLDVDINEEPTYKRLEVMETEEDENSMVFQAKGSHAETKFPLARWPSVETNGEEHNRTERSCTFDPGGDTSPKFLLLMFFVVTWFPP